MDSQQTPYLAIDRLTWQRLVGEIKAFAASEIGEQAKILTALLLGLLFVMSGLNVIGSFVGRDFMTAIEHRDKAGFIWQALLWVGVFALSTAVGAFLRFYEERLGLVWREWLTKRLVGLYLARNAYYHLTASGELTNPDQRIAEDVRVFTSSTLSFALMILNSSITVIAFSGVLWAISPLLFVVSVLYAAGGSYFSFLLGRSLAGLNYTQLDKEANFRADLIHVRENADSVALLHREERLKDRLLRRIDELVENFNRIIIVNRTLAGYSIGFNYLVQVIPALVVAPLFISGEAPFGIVAQSAIAFVHLVGAFSLIVTNFTSISTFTAVIARLGSLREAIEHGKLLSANGAQKPSIEVHKCANDDRVAFKGLTLVSPQDGRTLIKKLTASVDVGKRLLISGSNEDAKIALFRATAAMWNNGKGHIYRPEPRQIYFLPERPYLPPGTLRDLLVRTGEENTVSEEHILAILHTLKLDQVIERAGGLDTQHDWHDMFSLSEQQLIAFARLFLAAPRFAFLDRIRTALSPEEVSMILDMLRKQSISYLSLGRSRHGHRDSDDKLHDYDAVLELMDDGSWHWQEVKSGHLIESEGEAALKKTFTERRTTDRRKKS